MPIDTIKMRHEIKEDEAEKVINGCVRKMAYELESGDIRYDITTGELSGTYDSRISVRVWKDVEWYISVEGSLHKALLGHNVYGGTDDILAGTRYMHDLLQNIFEVKIRHEPGEWELMRIDEAEIYDMGSFEAVQDYIKALNMAVYPRREVKRYGTSGLAAYGQVSTTKIYHKGPEFWKNDRKRLSERGIDTGYIQELANKILRVEVEVKSRKLKSLYGRYPKIREVDIEMIKKIHDYEVMKLLKEGKSEYNQVKNTLDVKQRLFNLYTERMAASLLATWYQLSTVGENEVKKQMKKANYYKHLKMLKEAGVSWYGTDIVIVENERIPSDFIPLRKDKRHIVGEDEEVRKKLEMYRKAV